MKAATILLIDIGNTRLKWALWNGRRLQAGAAIEHGGQPARALGAIDVAAPQSLWISNVTGAPHEAALVRAAQRLWKLQPHFARSEPRCLGLKNSYREPARLGIDRWLVLLAAWQRYGSAVCVADAGTALTVDCADAQGRHLGGFIAPGLLTAQKATLGATRFATRKLGARYDGGLGRDTEACVRQGAFLGCLGAIDRASRAAGPRARKLITGGDAVLLLPQLDRGWEHRPLLVLEGLLALALSPR